MYTYKLGRLDWDRIDRFASPVSAIRWACRSWQESTGHAFIAHPGGIVTVHIGEPIARREDTRLLRGRPLCRRCPLAVAAAMTNAVSAALSSFGVQVFSLYPSRRRTSGS